MRVCLFIKLRPRARTSELIFNNAPFQLHSKAGAVGAIGFYFHPTLDSQH